MVAYDKHSSSFRLKIGEKVKIILALKPFLVSSIKKNFGDRP